MSFAALVTLVGCGTSHGATSGTRSVAYSYGPDTCAPSQYIGNRRSHALHPPTDHDLPLAHNQVCFNSPAAGEAAGYHLVRGSHGNAGYTQPHGGQSHTTYTGRQAKLVIPGHPVPREEVFHGCPGSGEPAYDPYLNLLKNRVDRANRPASSTIGQFAHLPWPHVVSDNHIAMPDWTKGEKTAIYRNEDRAISLTGYIADLKQEGPESPNCEGRGGGDWHIWLASAPHASRGQSIITEATPRVRAREGRFNFNSFENLRARGVQVRIIGWSMLDYEHPEQLGWDRATLWELHPVTEIDIRRGNRWIKITG